MDKLKASIGNRIKSLRKELNISQEALANKADIDRTYMTDIEKGRRNVSIEILYKITTALDKTLTVFFDDKMFGSGK